MQRRGFFIYGAKCFVRSAFFRSSEFNKFAFNLYVKMNFSF